MNAGIDVRPLLGDTVTHNAWNPTAQLSEYPKRISWNGRRAPLAHFNSEQLICELCAELAKTPNAKD
jgi:hypothetical protein